MLTKWAKSYIKSMHFGHVGAIQVCRNEYFYANTEKCISCFCCHEMCPRKAIGFMKSILAKIFIKEI